MSEVRSRTRTSPARAQGESELGGRDGAATPATRPPAASAARSARRPASPPTSPTTARRYPVGGGGVAEEHDAPPVADPGPDA